jgi:hypothetical protein
MKPDYLERVMTAPYTGTIYLMVIDRGTTLHLAAMPGAASWWLGTISRARTCAPDTSLARVTDADGLPWSVVACRWGLRFERTDGDGQTIRIHASRPTVGAFARAIRNMRDARTAGEPQSSQRLPCPSGTEETAGHGVTLSPDQKLPGHGIPPTRDTASRTSEATQAALSAEETDR